MLSFYWMLQLDSIEARPMAVYRYLVMYIAYEYVHVMQ